jgi:hypothetical protein
MKDLKLFGVCGPAGYGTGFLVSMIETHSNFLKHHARDVYKNNGLSPMLITGPVYSPFTEKIISDRIENIEKMSMEDPEVNMILKWSIKNLESYLGLLYDYNYKEIPEHEDSIVIKMPGGLYFNSNFLDVWKEQNCKIIIAGGFSKLNELEERRQRVMGETYSPTDILQTQQGMISRLMEENYEDWLLLDMGKFVFGDHAEYEKLCKFLDVEPNVISYDATVNLYQYAIWNPQGIR